MSRTDQDMLSGLQRLFLEATIDGGRTWASGQWTAAEAVNLLNEQQARIARDLGVVLTTAPAIPSIPNQHRHDLPLDCLHLVHVAWQGADGVWTGLLPGDVWELDHGLDDWEYQTAERPLLWTVVEIPQRQVQVAPASWNAGLLQLTYVPRPALALATGSAVTLTLPDEITEIVEWATAGALLSKVGKTADPGRAAFASGLATVLAAGATAMTEGWT